MRFKSNFLRMSIFCVVFLVFVVVSLASSSVQASQPAQATAAPTISGTASAGGTPPAPPPLPTLGGDDAYPPCPQPIVATVSASSGGAAATTVATASANALAPTMAATSATGGATGGAATMAVTVAATTSQVASATGGAAATMAATVSGTMSVPAGGTAQPPTLGPFTQITGCTLTATLSGKNEVPKSGDLNATGTAVIMINRPATGPGMVCFQTQVAGLKLPATLAHIHAGPAGIAGPPVITLAAPDASGKAQGCVSGVDRSLIKAILTFPQDYYVNVHNADFPDGGDRGQLTVSGQ